MTARAATAAGLLCAAALFSGEAPAADEAEAPLSQRLDRLPVRFAENRGQFDPAFRFVAQGRGGGVGISDGGARFVFGADGAWGAVDVEFGGARVVPRGDRRSTSLVSWFQGPRAEWVTGVPTFDAVAFDDVWPGIGVVFTGEVGRVKYEFRVAAGAEPSAIRLLWRGASSVRVDGRGRLLVATESATLEDEAPVAWQEKDGVRVPVGVAFSVDGSSQGFALGAFDPSLPLVIDPAVVVYAGFLAGASEEETGNDVAVDAAGSAYVVGRTRFNAAFFPAKRGPGAKHNGGNNDAFVAKLTPDGDDLVYAGFVGGSGEDSAIAVAVDAEGCAYLTGRTTSTETSFPLAGGIDATANGMTDAFLTKVARDGTNLVWSGFLGGADFDEANALALDADRNLYVTGATSSPESSFPVLVGPSLRFAVGDPGIADAFVAKVKADGSGLVYAGYIGGRGKEEAFGLAVDAAGAAYTTGYTVSDEKTFPVKKGPRLVYGGGTGDAFLAKVAPGGASLEWCGYIGGDGHEVGYGVAVGADGAPWVSGFTSSSDATFPVAVGPSLKHGGDFDAFVAHVAADGASLLSCGYVGGRKFDASFGAALDGHGGLWIGGYTASNPGADKFPAKGGPSGKHGGMTDAFVARILVADASLASCGYLGGKGTEYSNGLCADAAGDVILIGSTDSDATTFPVAVGPGLATHGVGTCSFVAKVSASAPAPRDGWIVPERIRLRRKGIVTIEGFFDAGGRVPVLGESAAFTLDTTRLELPRVSRRGVTVRFATKDALLEVTPSRHGSSRAQFRLAAKADVAPTGELSFDMRLESGSTRCAARLARGVIVEPRFWIASARLRRNELSLTARFCPSPRTPPVPYVNLGIVGVRNLVSRGYFVDAANGIARLKDAYRPPPQSQSVDVELEIGDERRTTKMRMGRDGDRFRY